MLNLYYDPTEARDNTRLPQTVLERGTALANLEHATGADLLLTRKTVGDIDLSSLPSKLRLKLACEDGLLIQRKSGGDLIGSLQDLPAILVRMLEWSTMPFLVYTGDITFDTDGVLRVNGRRYQYKMPVLVGSLEWWQLRGGFIAHLPDDESMIDWLNMWDKRLLELQLVKVKEIVARPVKQSIMAANWKDTLAALPGIGGDRARLLGKEFKTLGDALCWLTDESSGKKVPGIGTGIKNNIRRYLGLKDGETLGINVNLSLEGKDNK
jgi:hypothetical protein